MNSLTRNLSLSQTKAKLLTTLIWILFLIFGFVAINEAQAKVYTNYTYNGFKATDNCAYYNANKDGPKVDSGTDYDNWMVCSNGVEEEISKIASALMNYIISNNGNITSQGVIDVVNDIYPISNDNHGGFASLSGNTITFGCNNGAKGTITFGQYTTDAPPSGGDGDDGGEEDEVWTVEVSYGCADGYEYTTIWDPCILTSISNNTLYCSQKATTYNPSRYTCGTKITRTSNKGRVEESCSVISCPTRGSNINGTFPHSFLINTPTIQGSNPYANNSDELVLSFAFTPRPSSELNGKQINISSTAITEFESNVKPNIVDVTGTGALTLKSATYLGDTLQFKLTSVTPLETTEGKITFKLQSFPLTFNGVNLSFLKPFVGEIEVRDMTIPGDEDNPDTWDWTGMPKIGTLSDYKLVVKQKKNFSSGKYPSTPIKISNGSESEYLTGALLPYNDGGDDDTLQLESKSLTKTEALDYGLEPTHNILFRARINTTKNATTMPENPGLQISKATISYTLGDKEVKYYLGPDGVQDIATLQGQYLKVNNPSSIKVYGGEFLGVKVIGGIQGGGNSEFTGQNQNISSISSMEARTQIRKNAYTYISSMTKGQIVNGVRYEEGNVAISGDNLNYETLVVKNGNVIINGNLNTNNNKLLGIIVLKDGYNVTTDWQNSGNVYVTPSVQNINAIIYADGGLISVKSYDSNNNKAILYDGDSTDRTQGLNRQLYMNGSLFTRNTIGGAVLANQTGDKYTLPGGAKTEEFNIALQYDLNYIRRGKSLCENAGGPKQKQPLEECTYKEPFIIKYDPRVQTTPPKLFGN